MKVTSTSPLAVSGVKVVSAVTGSPSTSRGSAVRLPSSSDFFTCMEPFKVYSLPGMRPEYFTVSTMTVSSSVTMFLSPSMPSSAEVVMKGCLTVTVCALSLMSAWAAISTPFFSRDSKATISVSWGMVRELKWNTTSTLPSAFSGVKVVSAVTGLPSTSRGFSVTLPSSSVTFTWRVPFKVYSLPGMRPVYSTVSMTSVVSSVMTFLSPSAPSTAVVPISGWVTVTVWFLSSMSAWDASSVPERTRLSKTTMSVLSSRSRESKVKVTSTLPSAFSGVKTVWPVTGLSPTIRGLPVLLE